MTKKKALELALAVVANEVKGNEVLKSKLEKAFEEAFSSKGGRVADIESLVKRDANGKITHLKDQHSGLFLPANAEVFYEDKSEKPRFVGTDGKGIKRLARASEAVYKKFQREVVAKKESISNQLLELDINKPDFKQTHAKLKGEYDKLDEMKPDYSVIDVVTGKLKPEPKAETEKN